MSWYQKILLNLPEVAAPIQKKLSFQEKLKWTGIILLLFFVLSLVPLFGLGQNELQRFELLSIILGASFGSILSLGIGPIVTASIVLQLLKGSGILKLDTNTHEGKQKYQGIQKISSIFFVVFEAAIYVLMGGLSPAQELAGTAMYAQLQALLIFQLTLGGILIMLMDEVVSKWGFGSGISLFIAAGVSQSVFIRALSPLTKPGETTPTGAIPALVQSLAAGDPQNALLMLSQVLSTIVIFVMAVFVQSMKIEIPLSFGRIRGHGIRWPLNFVYTSNIPIILVSAFMANIQLWAKLLQDRGYPVLGTFVGNTPATGLVSWLYSPDILGKLIRGSLVGSDILNAIVYMAFLTIGAVIFSWFWVQTSGMDAKSQAKSIMSSGLQVPGFRKDERVLERLLKRYITPLTVMGAITVGILSGLADISGTLTNGTGLLLTVMIVYKLYEDISKQHAVDMNPMLKKFMGG